MSRNKKRALANGFTLLELIISVAILTVVVGVVVQGLTKLQQRNTMEAVKVDLTQESREFMDQIVSDIHQAGFPSLKMSSDDRRSATSGVQNEASQPALPIMNAISFSCSLTFMGTATMPARQMP